MGKPCTRCGFPKRFSKWLCLNCWRITYGKPIKKTGINNKPYKIPQRSAKKIKEDKVYKVLRLIFLALYPRCERCRCTATDVHHMKGRGMYYLMVCTWLQLCRRCHNYITAAEASTESEDDNIAIVQGWSISKHKKEDLETAIDNAAVAREQHKLWIKQTTN